MNRRKFLTTTGVSAGMLSFGGLPAVAQYLVQAGYKFIPLRGNVGVFTMQGGTIGWLATKEGLAVVDSQFPEPAAKLIAELKKREASAFRYLINTHHHGDHTGGNSAFKGLVEHVLGHANCLINHRAVSQAQKSEAKQLFADTVFNERWKTELGGETINAQYFGPAHTNGDIVVHFENANVAHLGDLLFNKRYPFIDRTAGANIESWIDVLKKIEREFDSDTLFIFGHSLDPEQITGGKAEIRGMQNYLEKLLLHVNKEIKAGKTKEQIMQTKSIPGAEDYSGQGIERSLTAAFEELSES